MKEKNIDQIREITANAIFHDDELAMEGVKYESADIAKGVERILYKCPICKKEGSITEENGHIRCSCGLDATLDSCYKLHGAPFTRINEWFEWQQASIDTNTESLSSHARLGCCKDDGFMDSEAGEGEIYLDHDVFKISGTLHGEKIDLSISTDKIGAFPATPGDHFDIYDHGKLIYVYPLPDPNLTVKWVCFLDKLHEKEAIIL